MQRIFLIIPLISAAIFLPTLTTSPSPQMRLISLLAVSSLLCTAYILFFLPNGKSAEGRMSSPASEGEGPICRYITYLNGGLSVLVGLNAFHFTSKEGVHDGFWLFCLLPSGEPLKFLSAMSADADQPCSLSSSLCGGLCFP